MLWSLIVACKGDGDADPSEPSSTVTCAAQPDNALRVDCTVDLLAEAATTLTYTDPDGVAVTRTAEATDQPTYTLWGLRADTTYEVEVDDGASPVTTRFTTGPVPEGLAALTVDITGTSSLEAVLQNLTCDGASYAVVLDTGGALRWYQLVSPPPSESGPVGAGQQGGGGIFGLSLTDTPSVLMLADGGIREWAFTGEPGLTVDLGPSDPWVHHDVVRAGEDTLALFGEPITGPDGKDYMVDGVAVFDATGVLVDQWHLADHIDPSQLVAGGGPPESMGGQPPDADEPIDWSHANGITLADDGVWIVSFRWLSAVYGIDGNRDSPTFGEVQGIVTGDPASPIPSSFTVDPEGQFLGQHHATLVGDELTLFDNRQRPESSRTVTLRLDFDTLDAALVETHSVGEPCDIEGGAFPLPDGGVFATCATSGIGREFPPGSGDTPSFTILASCGTEGGEPPPPVGRIVPFSLP